MDAPRTPSGVRSLASSIEGDGGANAPVSRAPSWHQGLQRGRSLRSAASLSSLPQPLLLSPSVASLPRLNSGRSAAAEPLRAATFAPPKGPPPPDLLLGGDASELSASRSRRGEAGGSSKRKVGDDNGGGGNGRDDDVVEEWVEEEEEEEEEEKGDEGSGTSLSPRERFSARKSRPLLPNERFGAPLPPAGAPPISDEQVAAARVALEEVIAINTAREAREARIAAEAERRLKRAAEEQAVRDARLAVIKRKTEEAARRAREREIAAARDGKGAIKILEAPAPPREPPAWCALDPSQNLIPRGRIELKIKRVSGMGEATGDSLGKAASGRSMTATVGGGLLSLLTGRSSITSPRTGTDSANTDTGDGSSDSDTAARAERIAKRARAKLPVGDVYVRLELHLGAARLVARSNVYRNTVLTDFLMPGCELEFALHEGIPVPALNEKARPDQKALLPPILFYSVWRCGTAGRSDRLCAEGQIPAGILFQSTWDASFSEVTLPLAAPGQGYSAPTMCLRDGSLNAWMTAESRFTPSAPGILAVSVLEGRELPGSVVGRLDSFAVFAIGPGGFIPSTRRREDGSPILCNAPRVVSKGTVCKEGGSNPMFNHEELVVWVDHVHSTSEAPAEISLHASSLLGRSTPLCAMSTLVSAWTSDILPHDEELRMVRVGSSSDGTPVASAAAAEGTALLTASNNGGLILLTRQFYPAGQLTVRIVKGLNVAAGDLLGDLDPYVRIEVPGRVRSYSVKTRMIPSTGANPFFDETFVFDIVDHHEMHISLWDYDQFTADDLIGEVVVSLLGVFKYGVRDAAVPIKRKNAWGGLDDKGLLHIEVDFTGPPNVAYPLLRPEIEPIGDIDRKSRRGLSARVAAAQRKARLDAAKDEKARQEAIAENIAAKKREEEDFEKKVWTEDEIEHAFQKLDLNQDLVINRSELRHSLTGMGEVITDLELNEMIDMCDSNASGTVAFFEFYQLIRAFDPSQLLWKPKPEPLFKDRDWFAEGGVLGMTDRQQQASEAALASDAGLINSVLAGLKEDSAEHKALARSADANWRLEKKKACEFLVGNLGLRLSELQRAFRRFQRMPCYTSGHATFEEVCEMFNRDLTPTLTLYISAFRETRKTDAGSTTLVGVREMLLALSGFAGLTRPQRINFCFYLFDSDGSGSISEEELVSILKASNLAASAAHVRAKAAVIIKAVDKAETGIIDLEAFVVATHRFPNVIFPNYDPSGVKKEPPPHPLMKEMEDAKVAIEVRRARKAASAALSFVPPAGKGGAKGGIPLGGTLSDKGLGALPTISEEGEDTLARTAGALQLSSLSALEPSGHADEDDEKDVPTTATSRSERISGREREIGVH